MIVNGLFSSVICSYDTVGLSGNIYFYISNTKETEVLAKYFDKQVWYTDEGKSSGEITLPENRQKLVEMILKLEK